MNKFLVLILCMIFFSTVTAQNTITGATIIEKAIELAENPDKLAQHRDSASVLSSIWNLSRNYTLSDFKNQAIEWRPHIKGKEAIRPGTVLMSKKGLFLSIKHYYVLSLDPRAYRMVTIPQDTRYMYTGIRPNGFIRSQIVTPPIMIINKPASCGLIAYKRNRIIGLAANETGTIKLKYKQKKIFAGEITKGRLYSAEQIIITPPKKFKPYLPAKGKFKPYEVIPQPHYAGLLIMELLPLEDEHYN